MKTQRTVETVMNGELAYAREVHPVFPLDISQWATIICEEAGEVAKASNDWKTATAQQCDSETSRQLIFETIIECSHTAATALRAMEIAVATIGDKEVITRYKELFKKRGYKWPEALESVLSQESTCGSAKCASRGTRPAKGAGAGGRTQTN